MPSIESLRVLHVIAGMDPTMGGVCQAVRTMISGLKKLNVYNEVVSFDAADANYLRNDPFITHAVGNGRGPWSYNKDLLPWLKSNVNLFNVVIVHGIWLYHGYAVKEIISSLRKSAARAPKFFVMPHGMLDPYFQTAEGRKLKAIRNWIFWQLVEKKIVNSSDGLLFTCEMERELAQKTFNGYRVNGEFVVGLGVEDPPSLETGMQAAFTSRIFKDIGPYFLFISRIHPKKGVDLLIKAYSDLKKVDSALPALVIAGPGLETDYGRQLQALASEHIDIHLTGMLSGKEKWGAFYGCEAFILPSHQENFGIAVVEALACGKPALISNQVNIFKEVLESGGGIVAEDNLEGVQALLKGWVKLSETEKRNMGLNARECFETNFAVPMASSRLLKTLMN